MSDAHQADASIEDHEADSPETIALAREMGWKPESEWRGDPPRGGFTSATEYVRRGEKILPIVNARARKAEERVAALEKMLEQQGADHRDTVKRIERMTTVALENQRTQIHMQYAAIKEAAVEVGDKAAYRQAEKDEREATAALDERLAEKAEETGKKQVQAELPKAQKDVIDGWVAENPWFNSDEEMNALANARHLKLIKDKPGLSLAENLAEVREYVRKRFPEKFADAVEEEEDDPPPRRRGSPVEGSSRIGGGGGGSKFSRLPAEARAICDKFIKEDGLFLNAGETVEKNLNQARERYAEQYLGDQ